MRHGVELQTVTESKHILTRVIRLDEDIETLQHESSQLVNCFVIQQTSTTCNNYNYYNTYYYYYNNYNKWHYYYTVSQTRNLS